jgi:hypothetical protein
MPSRIRSKTDSTSTTEASPKQISKVSRRKQRTLAETMAFLGKRPTASDDKGSPKLPKMDKNNCFNVLETHVDDEDEEELILNHRSPLMAEVQEVTHQGGGTKTKKKSSLPPVTSSSTIPLEGPKKAISEGDRAKERGTKKTNSHELQGVGVLPDPKNTPQPEEEKGIDDIDPKHNNQTPKATENYEDTPNSLLQNDTSHLPANEVITPLSQAEMETGTAPKEILWLPMENYMTLAYGNNPRRTHTNRLLVCGPQVPASIPIRSLGNHLQATT